jgi:hypothetical protein
MSQNERVAYNDTVADYRIELHLSCVVAHRLLVRSRTG